MSRLAILDVGHGSCAVVVHGDTAIIIDAGFWPILEYFLEYAKVGQVEAVLISHTHADHIQGLQDLLLHQKKVPVRNLLLNPDPGQTSDIFTIVRQSIGAASKEFGTKVQTSLTTNDSKRFSFDDTIIEVLFPIPELTASGVGGTDLERRKLTAHSLSAVVRVKLGNRPVAFIPGDLNENGLEYLKQAGEDCQADVLVFPHHGGLPGDARTSRDAELLRQRYAELLCKMVRPSLVLFSIGRGQYGTPRPDIVSVVRRTLPSAHLACTQLSTHCSEWVPSAVPRHLDPSPARGKTENCCCAGTMIIESRNENLLISPLRRDHSKFVRIHTPTALCTRQ